MPKKIDTALGIIRAALTFGINPSLEPIRQICSLMGDPQDKYLCIQVAGTNGKSSTCRYLAALLGASGYSTGLYTSPELVSITDRIEINGKPVDEEVFASSVIHVHEKAASNMLELTEFELITAAALRIFAESEVDYAVLEVGLGGRWDATTVVHPPLVVLTGVDLDHTAILGSTIAEIAAEKAAVIKRDSTVVVAPTALEALEVFRVRAAKMNARYVEVPAKEKPEMNSYQAQNKLTALTAFFELSGNSSMDRVAAQEILNATTIPGRFEIVHDDPLVIIDAAHNPASAHLLAETLQSSTRLVSEKPLLLLAVLADKDARGIIEALVPSFSQIAVTQTLSDRAILAGELALLVEEITGHAPQVFENPEKALEVLLTKKQPIVATGSITLAGAVKRAFSGQAGRV